MRARSRIRHGQCRRDGRVEAVGRPLTDPRSSSRSTRTVCTAACSSSTTVRWNRRRRRSPAPARSAGPSY